MNKLKTLVCVTSLGLMLFACADQTKLSAPNTTAVNTTSVNANSLPTPDELAAAKKIYADRCAKCHKDNGEGGEFEIEGTKIKVPSYKSEKLKKEPDSEYIDQIEGGGDGMPKFKGKITDQEIKDLVKLIRRDFQK